MIVHPSEVLEGDHVVFGSSEFEVTKNYIKYNLQGEEVHRFELVNLTTQKPDGWTTRVDEPVMVTVVNRSFDPIDPTESIKKLKELADGETQTHPFTIRPFWPVVSALQGRWLQSGES